MLIINVRMAMVIMVFSPEGESRKTPVKGGSKTCNKALKFRNHSSQAVRT